MVSSHELVILDTDVWSFLYGPRRTVDPRVAGWRDVLSGSTVAIAAQTRAEVLAGVYGSNWGERRRAAVVEQLGRTATIPVDERVIEQYAQLTATCKRVGHGLAGKVHSADRWVAATAMALAVPLLAVDGIYYAAPGLRLVESSAGSTQSGRTDGE